MLFQFSYKGGVVKLTEHSNEKFLLFFLIGEQEVPFYQMLKEGLANRVESGKEVFVTKHQVCKLFVSRQGFGIPRQFHSFYIKLDSDMPTLKILPFSEEKTGFYFQARSRMMERTEVLEALPESLDSKVFFKRQEVLPLDLANRMVHVDRSEMKQGLRHVKIGGRRED